jgi:glycosyltransferase involved in cell wall biosynthesis
MLKYMEKIFPEDTEIFLFTTKSNKNSIKLNRIKIVDTNCSKLGSFIELRKFCRKNKINRIISLGLLPYEEFVLLFSAIFSKTDFLYFNLGNPIEAFKIGAVHLRLIALFEMFFSCILSPFPKKIILPSKDLTNLVKKCLFFSRKKIFYLPPTLSTKIFHPKDRNKTRKKLGLKKEDKVIIYVGRIGFLKGSDILSYVIEKNPDKKFIIIGNLVDNNFKKTNFPNIISFSFKPNEELVDYYNSADLCFFPTRIEGLPVVPREAMACGTPVIISDILPVKSMKHAIKVEINKEKMNSAIQEFFNLPSSERKELSEKSREFTVENYDDDSWKEEYIKKILN